MHIVYLVQVPGMLYQREVSCQARMIQPTRYLLKLWLHIKYDDTAKGSVADQKQRGVQVRWRVQRWAP